MSLLSLREAAELKADPPAPPTCSPSCDFSGVYDYLCTPDELKAEPRPYVCKAQDLRLNAAFGYATIATNVAALPVGLLLDARGPRVTSLLGAFFFALGCGSMALNVTGGSQSIRPCVSDL